MKEMKRGSYGRRIEYYTHEKTGDKIPIFFDASKSLFTALVADVALHHESHAKLKVLIDQTVQKQSAELEWFGVIEISFGYRHSGRFSADRDSCGKDVHFQFERYWIAKKIDGKWLKSDWTTERYSAGSGRPRIEIGDRLERAKEFSMEIYNRQTGQHEHDQKFKLPYTKHREDQDDNPEYYLPYDVHLWDRLKELAKSLDKLQFKLIEILGSPDKRAALVSTGSQKLLPAAKD